MNARGSCLWGLGAIFAFTFCATASVAQFAYADYRDPSQRANTGVTPGGYVPFDGMTAPDGSRIGGFGSYYMRWYPERGG